MLDLVTATRYDQAVSTGRNHPLRLAAEKEDGSDVEIVAKISARCENGLVALVAEAIAAMLAADLELPVPEPHLVKLLPEFINSIPDLEVRRDAQNSVDIAFGSSKLPNGFAMWPHGKNVPKALHQIAVEVFAFDGLIGNFDRGQNPLTTNLMIKGASVAIIDHDLAFPDTETIIGHRVPWELGGLQQMAHGGSHVFSGKLSTADFDLSDFAAHWKAITDARLDEYLSALPREWNSSIQTAQAAVTVIREVRDNIGGCMTEVERALRV